MKWDYILCCFSILLEVQKQNDEEKSVYNNKLLAVLLVLESSFVE